MEKQELKLMTLKFGFTLLLLLIAMFSFLTIKSDLKLSFMEFLSPVLLFVVIDIVMSEGREMFKNFKNKNYKLIFVNIIFIILIILASIKGMKFGLFLSIGIMDSLKFYMGIACLFCITKTSVFFEDEPKTEEKSLKEEIMTVLKSIKEVTDKGYGYYLFANDKLIMYVLAKSDQEAVNCFKTSYKERFSEEIQELDYKMFNITNHDEESLYLLMTSCNVVTPQKLYNEANNTEKTISSEQQQNNESLDK